MRRTVTTNGQIRLKFGNARRHHIDVTENAHHYVIQTNVKMD